MGEALMSQMRLSVWIKGAGLVVSTWCGGNNEEAAEASVHAGMIQARRQGKWGGAHENLHLEQTSTAIRHY